MQKVVTLYLSAWKVKHGTTEEHLASYLSDGWRVVSLTAAGGTATMNGVFVWFLISDIPGTKFAAREQL